MKTKTAEKISELTEYFFSKKLKEIALLNQKGLDIINLGIGNPDLSPSKEAIDTLVQSALNPLNHGYQGYSSTKNLRNAYSTWYRKFFNVDLNPEDEILPLMGSKEGIFSVCLSFVNTGDHVLIPDPGYPVYKKAVEMVGATAVSYNLTEENGWEPDFDELEHIATQQKIKLMWVNYPNMPTGAMGSVRLFESFIAFAKKHNIILVNDNPYSFILNDNPTSIFNADGAMDIALELNSLSKSHNMAGWRVGMIAGKSNFIDAIQKVKSNIDSGMFLPVMEAAAIALQSNEDWYKQINHVYFERKAHVFQLLDKLRCEYSNDQVGMFVWAKIPGFYTDSFELSDKLLNDALVFVAPGSIFGKNGDRYIRISLCNPVSRIHEALNRIYLKF